MSEQMNLPDMHSAPSSPASADGPSRCDSPDGRKIAKSGREVAPVSRSASWGNAGEQQTSGTCGQPFTDSSPSAALQRALANRLRAALDVNGSPEYSLTWRDWTMPSREPICALRASARRTSDSGSTGWPTPNLNARGPESRESKNKRGAGGIGLQTTALIAGWCSTTAQDGTRGGLPSRPQDTGVPLSQQAVLAGYPTASSRDRKDTPGIAITGVNPDGSVRTRLDQLPRVAGLTRNGISASMGSAGGYRLNPCFSRWLMGFPEEWDYCGATAMESCRKSRRRS